MRTLLCCRFNAFSIVSAPGLPVPGNVLAGQLAARYRLRGRTARNLVPLRSFFARRVPKAAAGIIQKKYVTNITVFPTMRLVEPYKMYSGFLRLLRHADAKQELTQFTDRLFQQFLRREQEYYRTKPTKAQELLRRYWGERQPPRLPRQRQAFPQAFPVLGALLSLPQPNIKTGPPLLHRENHSPPAATVPAAPANGATINPVLTERELRFVTQTVYAELERQLRGENLRRGR